MDIKRVVAILSHFVEEEGKQHVEIGKDSQVKVYTHLGRLEAFREAYEHFRAMDINHYPDTTKREREFANPQVYPQDTESY